MREIKFRTWDTLEKQMLVVEQLNLDDGEVYTEGDVNSLYFRQLPEESEPNCVLMQFTGLTDKNGNEIYEGDVLRNTKSKDVFEVHWDAEMATFEGIDRRERKVGGVTYGPTLFPMSGKLEIIGNIYENPKLLTV